MQPLSLARKSPFWFCLALTVSRRSIPDLVRSGVLLRVLVTTVLLSIRLSKVTCVLCRLLSPPSRGGRVDSLFQIFFFPGATNFAGFISLLSKIILVSLSSCRFRRSMVISRLSSPPRSNQPRFCLEVAPTTLCASCSSLPPMCLGFWVHEGSLFQFHDCQNGCYFTMPLVTALRMSIIDFPHTAPVVGL